MSSPKIRVGIIDDHVLIAAGLKMFLSVQPDLEVIWEATNREGAFEAVKSKPPDILLVDLQLNKELASEFLEELIAVSHARAIILTGISDTEIVQRAIQAGAVGLVYKDEDPAVLVRAIRAVHGGDLWLSRSMITAALSRLREAQKSVDKGSVESARIASLTAREREIISVAANGLNRRQMAERLFVSAGTVRNHMSSILSKLGVPNQLTLVLFAQKHGLDKPFKSGDRPTV